MVTRMNRSLSWLSPHSFISGEEGLAVPACKHLAMERLARARHTVEEYVLAPRRLYQGSMTETSVSAMVKSHSESLLSLSVLK
jgi:hypothetical protein